MKMLMWENGIWQVTGLATAYRPILTMRHMRYLRREEADIMASGGYLMCLKQPPMAMTAMYLMKI